MDTVPTPPLAVDLDGSLVRTDTLWETLFTLVRDRPFALLAALASLGQGRAAFKTRLVTLAPLEVASLPLNTELIDWLRQEGAPGRRSVFEEVDRPALGPLPLIRYEFAKWQGATVGIDDHVELDRHYDSVPYR